MFMYSYMLCLTSLNPTFLRHFFRSLWFLVESTGQNITPTPLEGRAGRVEKLFEQIHCHGTCASRRVFRLDIRIQ